MFKFKNNKNNVSFKILLSDRNYSFVWFKNSDFLKFRFTANYCTDKQILRHGKNTFVWEV